MPEPAKKSDGMKEDPLESTSHAGLWGVATILLVAATTWAFWDEARGRRPWKRYQEEFAVQAQALLETQLEEARKNLEGAEEYRDLASRVRAAMDQLHGSPDRQAISTGLEEIDHRLAALRKQFMIARGEYQAIAYRMELTRDVDTRAALLAELKAFEEAADEISREMELLEKRKSENRARLREMESEVQELQQRLAELEEPARVIERRLAGIHGMEVEVRQHVNPELGVIDRCPSCHPAVGKEGFLELPNPFRSHPAVASVRARNGDGNGDLLTGHNVEKFGCTPCHRGQGFATTSVDKAHGSVEYWPTPMLEGEMAQAPCLKCHAQEPHLQGAPLLNEGRRLVSELGCFGCHNFGDYLTPEERSQQIGPDLQGLTRKVYPAWLVRWIEKPMEFRPDTLMPDFRFSRAEAEAIASYLWQNGTSGVVLSEVEPFDESNIGPGRRLFETRGCLGCHRIGDEGNRHAPNLSRVGEKVRYEYLANWVAAPHEVDPETEMPFLNLQREDAAKIAAYLSTLGGEVNSQEPTDLGNPELAAWGRSLITMYNCYGCHVVPGFEDTETLVPDIYTIGSNPIERFDFGLLEEEILGSAGLESPRENVGKARELWIRNKLRDPRCFDEGKYKKDFERLRMPDFKLSAEKIGALTTFLLGLTGETVPEAYRRVPSEIEKAISRGRFLFDRYRCWACHGREGVGNVVNPNYVQGTVPALNRLARVMMLWSPEDVEALTRELVKGVPLDSLLDDPPVRRFNVVLAKYEILRDTIFKGSPAGKADPEGPEPPYNMPSWREILGSRDVDDLLVYFLSTYPREER